MQNDALSIMVWLIFWKNGTLKIDFDTVFTAQLDFVKKTITKWWIMGAIGLFTRVVKAMDL